MKVFIIQVFITHIGAILIFNRKKVFIFFFKSEPTYNNFDILFFDFASWDVII